MTQRTMSPVLLAVLVAFGCGGSSPQDAAATTDPQSAPAAPIQLAQATENAQPADGGISVQGTVTLTGTAPDRKKIQMAADPVCLQQHTETVYGEDVVVNEHGALQNVFIYVTEGVSGSFAAPSEPVVLNQTGCGYSPHVFGIQVGQPLEIVNSDATLHNVNAKPSVNRPFNIAQPVKGMKTTKTFTRAEVMVPFKCNVHPWMSAYGGVVDHPFFAVSGSDGSFAISGLAAGTYTLEAWHEVYGTQRASVTIADGETASIEFSFAGE